MGQAELFCEYERNQFSNTKGFYREGGYQTIKEPPGISGLFELSVNAYYAALYAVMSELPIKGEISRFIDKVKEAGGSINDKKSAEARTAADRAASDRGDPDVLVVLKASGRVLHEIHRLTGLLRFIPDHNGVYIARCTPDHYILPALAEHFTLRFGNTPWAIIDERRSLCLCREGNSPPQLIQAAFFHCTDMEADKKNSGDSWEDLWRLYHRTINIESKKNLKLQRQLMPVRYHKYLTELE